MDGYRLKFLIKMSAQSESQNSGRPYDYYEVQGCVENVIGRGSSKNSPIVFSIKTIKQNVYRLTCPFFCPVQPGDAIYALVKPTTDRSYEVIRQPFVQVPVDKENVAQCFIRALRGTGFGSVSADMLYEKLQKLAKECGYGEHTLGKCTSVNLKILKDESRDNSPGAGAPVLEHNPFRGASPEDQSAMSNETQDPPRNRDDGAKTPVGPKLEAPPELRVMINFEHVGDGMVTNNKSRYKGDGVIPYLSEIANAYNRTADNGIIQRLVNGTNLDEKKIHKLLQWWHKSRSLRRLHLLGLTNTEIEGCKLPLDDIYEICLVNPYRLPAIEMGKCQAIMASLGKEPTHIEQSCGRIIRKIYDFSSEKGWTGTPMTLLSRQFRDFHQFREFLITDYGVTIDYNLAYLPYQLKVEIVMAKYLDNLIKKTAGAIRSLPIMDTPQIETAVYECPSLTKEQKLSVIGALTNRICIITGGAGTGKTTVIREIVKNLQIREIPYITCAFTGKAVSRLQEVLQSKLAATMDRLISRSGEVSEFRHVIADEGSMITTELLYRFVNAFPQEYRLTIVGDCNQLPPVSWGTLMKQLMISGRVPIYYLTDNQRIIPHRLDTISLDDNEEGPEVRSAPGDRNFDRTILENANALIDPTRDIGLPLEFKQGPGFYQVDGNIETVTTIVKALHDTGINSDRIMAISPYNEYIREINSGFQTIYHESSHKCIDKRGTLWCVGDRVMMTKNNYTINIMNGSEGKVISLTDEGVNIDFGDGAQHLFRFYSSDPQFDYKPVSKGGMGAARGEALTDDDYNSAELTIDQIQHSYAVTVHKSQGSEREFVIFYIPRRAGYNGQGISNFLNINLFYTGVTRTKRSIWVVGDPVTIAQATCNKQPPRHEALGYRLKMMKDPELEQVLENVTQAPMIEPQPGTSVALTDGIVTEAADLPQHDDDLWSYE
jgi:hypothetical protein